MSQAITPSPIPSPTLTPAPTGTATPTPTITPTPTPAFPASLTPEDQQFLLDNADNPDLSVSGQVNADGVTEVEINQPLNLTEEELKAKIRIECAGFESCIGYLGEEKEVLGLRGVYSGKIKVIIDSNGSTEVITSMFFLVDDQVREATMRWFLDPKDETNEWLYLTARIQGDRATLAEIVRIFAAGKPASPIFYYTAEVPAIYRDFDFYNKHIVSRYDESYYAAIRVWIESGFDPDFMVELPVAGD